MSKLRRRKKPSKGSSSQGDYSGVSETLGESDESAPPPIGSVGAIEGGDSSEEEMVDLYGPSPPSAARKVAGAVFGNLIVDAFLGPAEESYKVPADYRAFADYSSSDYDRSDDPDSKVKERLHAKPTRVMDRSSNESSSSTISKDSEVENLVVGTDEATNLASALHALHKLLPSGAESDMTSLASALLRMTHGAPGQVDSLTGACRSTSDALLRLEYELKRAQWRTASNQDDDDEEAEFKAIVEGTGLPGGREARDKATHPYDTSSGRPSGPLAAPRRRGGEVASPAGSSKLTTSANSKAVMEEEMFVMDAVQGILSKSSAAPDIFWSLLEERYLQSGAGSLAAQLLSKGKEAAAVPGLWSDTRQLGALGSVALLAVGYAWAVPALYQRYGAVLLLAAALLAQVPLLGVGSWLWRDARTQSLGAIFATLGSMGTPLTVLGLEAVALSLGFYPGRPRDWHPRPFKYLLDTAIFPENAMWCCLGTAMVCAFIFLATADVPHLAVPLVASLRFALQHGPLLFWCTVRLNARVLGQGKLGLAQAEVWVDLALGVAILVALLVPLAVSWALEPPSNDTSTSNSSSGLGTRTSSSSSSSSSTLASTQSPSSALAASLPHEQGALRPGDATVAHAKRTRARRRHFLALGCDAAMLLAWASFSRLEKGHSETLELLYGLVNALLLVLALLTRRPSLLVGLFGLGWYQGYRAVDVFSRSEHYASSLQLFDDLCVLARCVDPYKSRPEF